MENKRKQKYWRRPQIKLWLVSQVKAFKELGGKVTLNLNSILNSLVKKILPHIC